VWDDIVRLSQNISLLGYVCLLTSLFFFSPVLNWTSNSTFNMGIRLIYTIRLFYWLKNDYHIMKQSVSMNKKSHCVLINFIIIITYLYVK
jgi:hypothetical protein